MDLQLSIFNNGTSGTSQVLFHPSLPLLFSLADGDEVGCWNYETGTGHYVSRVELRPGVCLCTETSLMCVCCVQRFRANEDVPLKSLLPRSRRRGSTASSPRSAMLTNPFHPLPSPAEQELPGPAINESSGHGGSIRSSATTAIARHLARTSMRLRRSMHTDFGWVVPPNPSLRSNGTSWRAFHQWRMAPLTPVHYTEADVESVDGRATAGAQTPPSGDHDTTGDAIANGVVRRHTTQITSMTWVNEQSNPLLLTGSNDGDVRVWSGMEQTTPSSLRCVTSFNALPDIIRGSGGSGLVMDWQPRPGVLVVGGNSSIVRCWDMEREQCVGMIRTPSNSCVTSIVSSIAHMALAHLPPSRLCAAAPSRSAFLFCSTSIACRPLPGQVTVCL